MERISVANSSLPILKNFLIETQDNKIKLSATDLELAVTSFVTGKIINTGELTIPLNIFSAIINNIQTERITLEIINNKLLIKTDNYQAEINGTKKEEFPIIPQITNTQNHLEIKNFILRDALASVINSTAAENKPELNGVLFDFQINSLKIVTTDSFRLSEKTINNNQFNTNFNKPFKIIIPSKAVQEVIKELQNNDEEKTTIFLDQNQILFKTEKTEIISRLINGEFPEYTQIIPKNYETEVIINKEELINAVKLAGIFAERLSEVKIITKESNKSIEVFSFSQIIGENKYLIPAKINGATMEAVFNWRFVLDGLKNIKSENIFLGLNSSNKPALIRSNEDESWFYVLMPIKNQ